MNNQILACTTVVELVAHIQHYKDVTYVQEQIQGYPSWWPYTDDIYVRLHEHHRRLVSVTNEMNAAIDILEKETHARHFSFYRLLYLAASILHDDYPSGGRWSNPPVSKIDILKGKFLTPTQDTVEQINAIRKEITDAEKLPV